MIAATADATATTTAPGLITTAAAAGTTIDLIAAIETRDEIAGNAVQTATETARMLASTGKGDLSLPGVPLAPLGMRNESLGLVAHESLVAGTRCPAATGTWDRLASLVIGDTGMRFHRGLRG